MSVTVTLGTILSAKDSSTIQGVQLRLTAYQTRSNVPAFGLHGIISRPLPGAQMVVLAPNGQPDKAVAVAVNDGRYYVAGLPDGTIGLGHHLGAHALLFDDRIEVDGGGKLVVVKNASKVRIEGDLEVTGQVTAMCDGAFVHLSTHTHPANGSAPNPHT